MQPSRRWGAPDDGNGAKPLHVNEESPLTSNGADPALVREVLRDVLAELLPELVAETRAPSLAPTSSAAVPAMPPPPVAAVHRPSSWGGAPAPSPRDGRIEEVSLASDADLQAFVQRLLQRFENANDRAAIRSGALRFSLRHGAAGQPASPSGARRIEHGAVTERVVREAAAAGGSLVLGPRAVLTPLARDVARSLGVTIEKEKRC
jgi:hypothetical protein